MKTVFRKKRSKSLGFEEAAKFNHLLDTNQALQRGMEQLALAYPYLEEKVYMEKALQLFREAGLDLSVEEFRILLTLRRQPIRYYWNSRTIIRRQPVNGYSP